jgi:hypothetical protein
MRWVSNVALAVVVLLKNNLQLLAGRCSIIELIVKTQKASIELWIQYDLRALPKLFRRKERRTVPSRTR